MNDAKHTKGPRLEEARRNYAAMAESEFDLRREVVRLRTINKDLLEALQRCATLMKNGFIPPENIGKDAEEIVSGDYANGWDAACEEFRNSRTAEIAQAAIAKAEGR